MKQFKDFSSFFFPSKGTFGGVQRRSANGYPNVRDNGSITLVRTERELRAAVQSAGEDIGNKKYLTRSSKIGIAENISLTAPIEINRSGIEIFGAGGAIVGGGAGEHAAFIVGKDATGNNCRFLNIHDIIIGYPVSEVYFSIAIDIRSLNYSMIHHCISGAKTFIDSQNAGSNFGTTTVNGNVTDRPTSAGAGYFFRGYAQACSFSGNIGLENFDFTGGMNNTIIGNDNDGIDTSSTSGGNTIIGNVNGTVTAHASDIYLIAGIYPLNS